MIIIGDALTELKSLKEKSVNCCVTSPPYFGLRDYGHNGQLGLESTPGEYVNNLLEVFREVSRVLKDDGTLWLNLGDSYAGNGGHKDKNNIGDLQQSNSGSLGNSYRSPGSVGLKPKDLIGIPWRVAFALQEDGWYLRQDIIWSKPNPMPESVKDRCTKAHEYIFLLSKSGKYYFDHEAVKEPSVTKEVQKSYHNPDNKKYDGIPHERWKHQFDGRDWGTAGMRNKRSVWTVPVRPYKGAHFATFPPDLIEPCVLAGCPQGGIVLDPFFGSGTVGEIAQKNDRDFIGIELNPEYKPLIDNRLSKAHFQCSF